MSGNSLIDISSHEVLHKICSFCRNRSILQNVYYYKPWIENIMGGHVENIEDYYCERLVGREYNT